MNNYIVIFVICIILLATCFKFKERFDEYEAINHPVSTADIKYNDINATNEASLETEVAAKANMLADPGVEHSMNHNESSCDYNVDAGSSVLVKAGSAGITDVNNKEISNKPFANDSNIADYTINGKFPMAFENNPELIQKDMTCQGLSQEECQQKVVNISDSDINDSVRNKPINTNRYRYSKQYELPNTADYMHGKKAYSKDQVDVTGNVSMYSPMSGENVVDETHGHVWTSNNAEDNFNKVDMKQFMKPIIVQSNVKGVSNIFAPVIYIKDGEQQKPVPYEYEMNNAMNNMNNTMSNVNINDDDLLGSNNMPEPNNEIGLFEKDNIIIPK